MKELGRVLVIVRICENICDMYACVYVLYGCGILGRLLITRVINAFSEVCLYAKRRLSKKEKKNVKKSEKKRERKRWRLNAVECSN